jgi:hypothetical protein
VITLPSTQYSTAIHNLHEARKLLPPSVKANAPDRLHKIPMKLAATTAEAAQTKTHKDTDNFLSRYMVTG